MSYASSGPPSVSVGRKSTSSQAPVHTLPDQNATAITQSALKSRVSSGRNKSEGGLNPLVTSKLANVIPMATQTETDTSKVCKTLSRSVSPDGESSTQLQYLTRNRDKQRYGSFATSKSTADSKSASLDQLFAKLAPASTGARVSPSNPDMLAAVSEQQALYEKQSRSFLEKNQSAGNGCDIWSPRDLSPTENGVTKEPNCSYEESTKQDSSFEMLRLKQELDAVTSRLAIQEQELAQSRIMKHTLDQALDSPSDADFPNHELPDSAIASVLQDSAAFSGNTRPFNASQDPWMPQDDARSDVSDSTLGGYSRANRGIWGSAVLHNPFNRNSHDASFPVPVTNDPRSNWAASITQPGYNPVVSFSSPVTKGRGLSYTSSKSPPPSLTIDSRYFGDQASLIQGPGHSGRPLDLQGGSRAPVSAPGSYPPPGAAWGAFNSSMPANTQVSKHTLNSPFLQGTGGSVFANQTYQPQSLGNHLGLPGVDFAASGNSSTCASWDNVSNPGVGPTYVSPVEPVNYRRLLDKNVSCDWRFIVDKIVCSNDQQASIFLQQKLKVGTVDQKCDIVDSIVSQAYPLMVNRFGNFLVQRCFEHGSSDQVVAIANAIRGNTLSLSMDPFGCHVIQKAFDCVPEEYKAMMVHELLRRIPETVIHRYACHVWQKLFELRWSNEPPQIMLKVNEALEGMWHEVALGETGSLVVQNIFENCIEDEKRPAIDEVLDQIDVLARGQFGNWCIQHICEHGAPKDKDRAIEHILHNAPDYSMDQYASKVVEKCLKIGGNEFLDRYLGRVCTGRADRPRMPLIDIAGDQYGNYLIQWILVNSTPQHREHVASHIRKHMVSLRGSKFGSRVAMLCCNPSHATRPGPGVGPQISRFAATIEERVGAMSQPIGRLSRNNATNNGSNGGSGWNSGFGNFR